MPLIKKGLPSGYVLPVLDWPRSDKIAVWGGFGTVSLLAALSCGIVVVALISNKQLMQMPFMRLALFLLIPDFFNGFYCMQCYLNLLSASSKIDVQGSQDNLQLYVNLVETNKGNPTMPNPFYPNNSRGVWFGDDRDFSCDF